MNIRLNLRVLLASLGGSFLLAGVYLTGAMAEEPKTPHRIYIGGSVGATRLSPESTTDSLSISDRSDFGYGLTLGIDLSRRFSLEGYYHDLGTAGVDFLGDHVGGLDYAVYGVGVVGYLFGRQLDDGSDGLTYREGLSGFLRAGVGGLRNDSNLQFRQNHRTHATFGLGLEYGWSNGFAIRTEVQSYDTDAQFVHLSLLKRFGQGPATSLAVPVAAAPAPAPAPRVALTEPKPEVEIPTIYFEFSKYDLTAEARAKLDRLAAAMARDPSLKLQLDGHTDWIDTEKYNMNLSLQRAIAVRDYLHDRGLPRGSARLAGYGESQPVSTNETDEGRALNRRVEISLQ